MSNDAPLSLESAMGLLRESAPAENEPAKDAGSTADWKTPSNEENVQNSAPSSDKQPDNEPAKEAATDTPADQGDVNDEDVEQGDGDALPPIEPPSFWKAEDKAAFKDLPRSAQEVIHRREQERDVELRNLQNRNAEAQKTVDVEVTRLKGLAEKIGAHVQNEVKALANEFPEIKSEADVTALAQRDPARFSVFQARLMEFNAARQAEAEAQTALQQRSQVQQQEMLGKAKEALLEAFPAWKDPAVAKKEVTELQDYAIKHGVSEQAARSTLDPNVYKFVQKAMLYDRAQQAKADAVKRDPPRVVKPGGKSSNPKADGKAQDRQTRLNKLNTTHALEDAVGLLRM